MIIKNMFAFASEAFFGAVDTRSNRKKGDGPRPGPSVKRRVISGLFIVASLITNYYAVTKLFSATVTIVELKAEVREKVQWEQSAIAYRETNEALLALMGKYLSCEASTIKSFEATNNKFNKLHEAAKAIEKKPSDKNK